MVSTPRVSVLMATYNGEEYVRESVNSLLAQTFRDFELIVVDDCSTDNTATILANIGDSRLKIHRNRENLGVVASRNRCLALASGEYIAMQDHDDLSRPTRLERQVAYLDENSTTVLVATAANTLRDGKVLTPRNPRQSSPALIHWLLLIANPLVCSSIMFRSEAVKKLINFMRSDYTYADDFDLYHRLMQYGVIDRLDEPLTIYRQHDTMASRRHRDIMNENAVRVLVPHYQALFGNDAIEAASLVVRHISSMEPVPDLVTLRALKGRFQGLTEAALKGTVSADHDMILTYADELWNRVIRDARTLSRLSPTVDDAVFHKAPRRTTRDIVGAFLSHVPHVAAARQKLRRLVTPELRENAGVAASLHGRWLQPTPAKVASAPTLFVVVDTEAEFDWTGPMHHQQANVTAIEHIGRGQAVFDRYGLRPVYVVDYPVATNSSSVARLRAILDRGACEIGAHLHPWTTPPLEEELNARNSYPGNLPKRLERAKLETLTSAIQENFGIRPIFYKAGRYGFGEDTAVTLKELGFKVDFSLLPGADLRGRGGPDFRDIEATPYLLAQGLLAAPMTRSTIGFVPVMGGMAAWAEQQRLLQWFPWRSALARTRVADTITLTPEGVTTREQIRLIEAMLKQGQRQFFLHYHSPSLAAGHTSYAPDQAGVEQIVQRLEGLCEFFFERLGGLPGYPRDLVAG